MDQPRPSIRCVRCGRECSDRPRVREGQGWCCTECMEVARTRPVQDHGRVSGQAPKRVAAVAAGTAPVGVADEAPTEAKSCPVCLRPLAVGSTACGGCGFDRRVGLQPWVRVRGRAIGQAAMTCGKCRYDLHGIPGVRCPECGTAATLRRRIKDIERSGRDRLIGAAVRIALLVAGMGLVALYKLSNTSPFDSTAGQYLGAALTVRLPITLAVFLMYAWMFLRLDMPVWYAAAGIAGAFGATDLVVLGIRFLDVPFVVWVFPPIVFILLAMWLLELEVVSALTVGFVAHAAATLAYWTIAKPMFGIP